MNNKPLRAVTSCRFLLPCLLLLLPAVVRAQMGKHFDADNQMSSSFTTQVYIDRDGFIWVATRNGLNRYDGYSYQVYKKEARQDIGMASNYVNCILQDRSGLFYVGMYGALQTFDGEQFSDVSTFDLSGHRLPCYITCLLQRRNGDILVGTSGHGLLRMTDSREARQLGGALADLHTLYHIIEDRHSRLWMVTEDRGLLRYDGQSLKGYFQADGQRSTVLDVCEGADGTIYVATSNAGLFRLDGDVAVHVDATGSKHISTLYVSHSGNIMLGYDGMGLGIYDPKKGTVTDNPYYSREVDLGTAKVYSICEDPNGNVWLGLLQKGVYMHPGNTLGFGYMGHKIGERNVIGKSCVTSVFKSSNGYLWIGTDRDGLYVLDAGLRMVRHFKEGFPATVLNICEDRQQRLWIGSYKQGCGWIDQRTLSWHPYQLPQGPSVSVFGIVCDGHNRLWLGTMGHGLLCVDPASHTVRAHTMDEGATGDRTVNSIANNYIVKISLSPDGRRIYCATTMGVCALDIEKDDWLSAFGSNCLNYGTPTRIAREFDGKLRIGTNDGLLCYDLKSRTTEHHAIESGLADNGIASIEQDHQGRLWISTDHGLCSLDPTTGKTRNYFVDNGLQSNEFSDGASCMTPGGMMVFGGLAGITWFNPDQLGEFSWQAEVKLTDFLVNGQPVTPATMSGLWLVTDTTVIASSRFVLNSADNTFAMHFSTLTYDNPEHIVYRYRINDGSWVRMQPGVNELTFSHVSPGDYKFCVVAEHNGKTTPERCFTVTIHAPWYLTPLAFIVYLLLAALLLWLYLRQRRRKEQDRLRLQEHIHAEEMADAKLKFFINISHEIRTPMTLIITPLLSLIKQDDDPHRRSIYATIRRNAERILGLINQMMDLRKIDKGQMQMRMCETEFISFIGDIHTLFDQQAKAKNIRFTYEHDTQQLPVWIDRGNFDKVVVNILSNAFKFTPAGGEIHMSVAHDVDAVALSIRDTGEGIAPDKLPHIFERFYQAPSGVHQHTTGTGIGLDLTRSLVELHHGTITARNNADGRGAEFTVTLPLGNAHLKPEELIASGEAADAPHDATLADEQPAEVPSAAAGVPPRQSQRQRIVIVEDDGEIRNFLAAELSPDYDVATCPDGMKGLSEVLHTVPDLVISDIMMPEMDGNTMCTKIKANPATSHVPVILLTAKSRDEDQLEGLETGADAYVMKPFNMDILRRTIVNLIHTHQLLRLKYGRNDQLEEQVDELKMKSPDDQLLERVMKVINKNLSNSDLSIEDIADEVGISRVHLHRKMKELTGQTPHDFIRNLRLKQAANLLAQRNMNITEVMYACGFNNAASFSTIFKKFYGMSPRDYMNEHHK